MDAAPITSAKVLKLCGLVARLIIVWQNTEQPGRWTSRADRAVETAQRACDAVAVGALTGNSTQDRDFSGRAGS